MGACLKGHTAIAQALINARADVNAKRESGQTMLMLASKEGFTAIAQALIRAGADVNAKGKDGAPALIEASFEGLWTACFQTGLSF